MRIEFTRSGGFAGMRLNVVLDTKDIPEAEALELKRMVEAADFFNLPESMPLPGADAFHYKITIQSDNETHTVEADERAVPPALMPLVTRLVGAARSSR
ncbi:MAG: protealysin inhibitor emfourin [Candidatus Acidiferrum sp.]